MSTVVTEGIGTLTADPIILDDALVCDDTLLCDDALPCRDGSNVLSAIPIAGAVVQAGFGLFPSSASFPGSSVYPGSGSGVPIILTPDYIPWGAIGDPTLPLADGAAAALTRAIPARFPNKELANASYNATRPPPGTLLPWSQDSNNLYWTKFVNYRNSVTGNFVGTTEEIMVWTANKWGIDEDTIRAVCVQESDWTQAGVGDFANGRYHSFGISQVRDCMNNARFGTDGVANGTSTFTAASGAFVSGDVGHALAIVDPTGTKWAFQVTARTSGTQITLDRAVPFSGSGLTWNTDQDGWGGQFWTTQSTAVALDFWGCYIRSVLENSFYDGGPYLIPEGVHTITEQVSLHGLDYVLWGAIGSWFSGGWYDTGAVSYINLVKGHLAAKRWEQYT